MAAAKVTSKSGSPKPAVFSAPKQPKSDELKRAFFILKYGHDTAESLIRTYDLSYQSRGGKGRPTDEEQDLLRAMVVFAGAGLDSMTKQMIRDSLPRLVDDVPATRAKVQELVVRHLRGAAVSDDLVTSPIDPARLATILMADNPRGGIVEMLIRDLTAGSLQSGQELFRVATYLGVPAATFEAKPEDLKKVFDARNQIIHELDIDFAQKNANRRPRTRQQMVDDASMLLAVAGRFLARVDTLLLSE